MEGKFEEVSQAASDGSASRWQDVLCSEFHLIDLADSEPAAGFDARLARRIFPAGELVRFAAPNHRLVRSPAAIAQDNWSDIQLAYVAEGEVEFRQHGRQCQLQAGDCFIIDQGNPFDLHLRSRHVQNLGMQMPRSRLARHMVVEDIAGRKLDRGSTWGGVLSAYMRAIYVDFPSSPALSPSLMVEQALYLVQLAIDGQMPEGTTHQKGLLRRARSIMRELCHEEHVTPAAVAQAVGVSKGYLHRLFSQEGTTFCRDLDLMRIEQAACLLEAKDQCQLTISEVGIRCGLPSAPHFTRKFRLLKGVTPSQFRQAAMRQHS